MTVISYYDLFRFFFCFSIMLASATHKVTNRSHFYSKSPGWCPWSASRWGLTDPGSFLHATGLFNTWPHRWPGIVSTPAACKGKGMELHVEILQGPHHISSLAFVGWSYQMIAVNWRETGTISSACTQDREGVVILQQALAFTFGGIAVSWPRMSMGYIQSAQLSWQLYFDYLSYNLPDSEIEDNNTHLKKWFRYKRQAGHIIYSNKALINLPSLLVWTEHMFQAS